MMLCAAASVCLDVEEVWIPEKGMAGGADAHLTSHLWMIV